MQTIKKIFYAITFFIEIICPVVMFSCLFILFVFTVIMRYGFNSPLRWGYEMCSILYLWMGMFAMSTAGRQPDEQIAFSMLYDAVGPKMKKALDIIGCAMLSGLLIIAIKPSFLALTKLTTMSAVLRIPYNLIYIPYLLMLISAVLRYTYRLYQTVCSIFKGTSNNHTKEVQP